MKHLILSDKPNAKSVGYEIYFTHCDGLTAGVHRDTFIFADEADEPSFDYIAFLENYYENKIELVEFTDENGNW